MNEKEMLRMVMKGMILIKPKMTMGMRSRRRRDLKGAKGRIMGELNYVGWEREMQTMNSEFIVVGSRRSSSERGSQREAENNKIVHHPHCSRLVRSIWWE